MKILTWLQRPLKPTCHEWLNVNYVCSGPYDRDKAEMAAQVIRDEAGQGNAVVFGRYRYGFGLGSDDETAEIIAQYLGTQPVDSSFKYDVNDVDIHELSRLYLFQGINRFVKLINRLSLKSLMSRYPGPEFTLGDTDPAIGSVHTLQIHLDPRGKIADKRFI